jgi:hypothetical protein
MVVRSTKLINLGFALLIIYIFAIKPLFYYDIKLSSLYVMPVIVLLLMPYILREGVVTRYQALLLILLLLSVLLSGQLKLYAVWVTMFMAFILSNATIANQNYKLFKIKMYTVFSVVLIALAFSFDEFELGKRNEILGDPNISGFVMLILAYIFLMARFRLGIMVALMASMLFISRTYILSLLLLMFVQIYKNKLHSKLFSPSVIFISFTMIVFLLSLFYGMLYGNQNVESVFYANEYTRIANIFDLSNFYRLKTNHDVIYYLYSNWSEFLTGGIDASVYHDIISQKFIRVPHNTLLQYILLYGFVFTIVYILVIVELMSSSPNLRKAFIVIYFYSMFLHSTFNPTIIFVIVYANLLFPSDGETIGFVGKKHIKYNK